MAVLASTAVPVHAQAYQGGGEWYDQNVDYRRMAVILRQAGYRGDVSPEFEGRVPAATGVPVASDVPRAAGWGGGSRQTGKSPRRRRHGPDASRLFPLEGGGSDRWCPCAL